MRRSRREPTGGREAIVGTVSLVICFPSTTVRNVEDADIATGKPIGTVLSDDAQNQTASSSARASPQTKPVSQNRKL